MNGSRIQYLAIAASLACGLPLSAPAASTPGGDLGGTSSWLDAPFQHSIMVPSFPEHGLPSEDDSWTNDNFDGPNAQSQGNTPQFRAQTKDSGSSARNIALAKRRKEAADKEMRRQMRRVAGWLENLMVGQYGRFPGNRGDSTGDDDHGRAVAMVTALVPNNPYDPNAAPSTVVVTGFDPNVTTNTGETGSSPRPDFLFNTEAVVRDAAQQDHVRLTMNLSLTPVMIKYWATDPPGDWEAPPGTITAMGNNQGLFVVWGAGVNGKPVKDPLTGNTLIYTGSGGTVANDQIAPNEGQ